MSQDQRAIRIPDIPLGALFVFGGGRLVQLVDRRHGTVFGLASLWAPAAVQNVQGNGDIEAGAVDAGLPARDDLLNLTHSVVVPAVPRKQSTLSERPYALERQQIIEQTFSGIKSLADFLSLSQYGPLTPTQRLGAVQSLFDITAAQAAIFNRNAIQALPQVTQQLLAEGQSFYGGTQEFRDILTEVDSQLRNLRQLGGGNDRTVGAIDKVGIQSVQNTTQMIDQVRITHTKLDTLARLLGDSLDKLTRLLSAA